MSETRSRYLLYRDQGTEYLARITIEAQVPVTWQYEADPPHIPGAPGTLEDLAAQGYVAVTALVTPIVADELDEVSGRYWLTPAAAARVLQAAPPDPGFRQDGPGQALDPGFRQDGPGQAPAAGEGER